MIMENEEYNQAEVLSDSADPESVDWNKVYYRFRLQIENENNLYSQRLLWFIYIQAFLFATIGLLLGERVLSVSGVNVVDQIILVICLFGIYLGLLTKRLLDHATASLDEIRDHWNKNVEPKIPPNEKMYFPHVSGGVGGTVRTKGILFLRSRWLPLSFSLVWGVVFGLFLFHLLGS